MAVQSLMWLENGTDQGIRCRHISECAKWIFMCTAKKGCYQKLIKTSLMLL